MVDCDENDELNQQILYRSNEGFGLLVGLEAKQHSAFQEFRGQVRVSKYSPDGKYVAFATNQNEVFVVDVITGKTVQHFEKRDVQEFTFSPLSSCICLFERYFKSDNPKNNVFIIHISTGRVLFSTLQKNLKSSVIQWTSDESHFCRLVTNELHFYKIDQLLKEEQEGEGDEVAVSSAKHAPIAHRLHIENLADYSISPAKEAIFVSVFIPEKKGYPASVRIFQIPDCNVPIAQKNFFKADKVEMKWNRNGASLLVVTQTEVDQSGKSYYGESNLYLLSARGGFDAKVTLDKEGPVHDVVWNPKGKDFVVVYGYMPSKSVMFDTKCNLVFDFGSNHRNTAKFNPQGRLLCLAGFGNLAGDMDFWDCQELKKLAAVQDNATTFFDWAPDGRHLLTATLSPRLRVDNCFKIWHYHGFIKHKSDYKELYQVSWRPIKDETLFPMRSLTPPPKGNANKSNIIPEVSKAKAYIPPHQRAKMASAASANPSSNGSKNGKPPKSAVTAASIQSQSSSSGGGGSAGSGKEVISDAAKRKKALVKKLKQVELLKEKKKAGEALEINQIAKIEAEASLLKELEELDLEITRSSNLYIVNKAGGLSYQRDFSDSGHPRLSINDYLVLASTFQSVHAISTQISPTGSSSGIQVLETDLFKLHCHQTPTVMPAQIQRITLTNIPPNVLDQILVKVPVPCILNFSLTCKSLSHHVFIVGSVFKLKIVEYNSRLSSLGITPFVAKQTNEDHPVKAFKALYSTYLKHYKEYKSAGATGSSRLVAKAFKGNTSVLSVSENLLRLASFAKIGPSKDWEKVLAILNVAMGHLANSLLSSLESQLNPDKASFDLETDLYKTVKAMTLIGKVDSCAQLFLSKSTLITDFNLSLRLKDLQLRDSKFNNINSFFTTIKEFFHAISTELDFFERIFPEPYKVTLWYCEKVCTDCISELVLFIRQSIPIDGFRGIYLMAMVDLINNLRMLVTRIQKRGDVESLLEFMRKMFHSFESEYWELEQAEINGQCQMTVSTFKGSVEMGENVACYNRESMEQLKQSFVRDCNLLFIQYTWHSKPFDDPLLETCYQLCDLARIAIQRAKSALYFQPKKRDQAIEALYGILLRSMKPLCQNLFSGECEQRLLPYSNVGLAGDVLDELKVKNPFAAFFRVVFKFDLIQQMTQLFHEYFVVGHIDKMKLVSDSMSEKKAFEAFTDELVASGFDYCVQIVVSTMEKQLKPDSTVKSEYNVSGNEAFDATPTKKIRLFVVGLNAFLDVFSQGVDKQHLEVIYSEIGVRVYSMVCQYIKSAQVSEPGGFKLMSDLNLIHDWAGNLKSPEAMKLFDLLKDIANLYIIEASQIQSYLQEDHRFRLLRNEEIVSFLEARLDYRSKIHGRVESEKCIIQ